MASLLDNPIGDTGFEIATKGTQKQLRLYFPSSASLEDVAATMNAAKKDYEEFDPYIFIHGVSGDKTRNYIGLVVATTDKAFDTTQISERLAKALQKDCDIVFKSAKVLHDKRQNPDGRRSWYSSAKGSEELAQLPALTMPAVRFMDLFTELQVLFKSRSAELDAVTLQDSGTYGGAVITVKGSFNIDLAIKSEGQLIPRHTRTHFFTETHKREWEKVFARNLSRNMSGSDVATLAQGPETGLDPNGATEVQSR